MRRGGPWHRAGWSWRRARWNTLLFRLEMGHALLEVWWRLSVQRTGIWGAMRKHQCLACMLPYHTLNVMRLASTDGSSGTSGTAFAFCIAEHTTKKHLRQGLWLQKNTEASGLVFSRRRPAYVLPPHLRRRRRLVPLVDEIARCQLQIILNGRKQPGHQPRHAAEPAKHPDRRQSLINLSSVQEGHTMFRCCSDTDSIISSGG